MKSIYLTISDKLLLYAKGGWSIIFLSFLVIGPVLYESYGGSNLWLDLQFEYKDVSYARGYITRVLDTDKVIDEEPVFQFDYSFPIDLTTHYGTSYSSLLYYQTDDRVQVEYILENPELSRLDGSNFSDSLFLTVLGVLLSIIGLIALPVRLHRVNGIERMLQNSGYTLATFEGIKSTGIEINEQVQYKITYRYIIEGKSYYISRRTTDPSGKNRDSSLIYSKDDPTDVTFLSELPSRIAKKVAEAHT